MRKSHLSSSALMALIVASAVPAYSQSAFSQVLVSVTDAQGKPLSGVVITLRSEETGQLRTSRTESNGLFQFANMPVGPYVASASKDGFQSASGVKLYLSLNGSNPLNIRLASVTERTVEVFSSVSSVDPSRSSAATMISPENMNNLPVAGRSFLDFATLTPQVIVESGRGNLAIAGQRGVNTSVNLDGADNNESFFGGAVGSAEGKTPFTVSIEAVREFQVVTDGASAEYGRMGGGYINAVTKSGTNEYTGSLFYYKRPQNLVALRPSFGVAGSNTIADFKSIQQGFSFGGPLIKDKLFFFVAYDGQRKTTTNNFAWGTSSLPLTLDLTQASDQVLASKGGSYAVPEDSNVFFARLDWVANADNTFTLRYNKSEFKGLYNNGSNVAFENTTPDVVDTESLVGQWNWTISSNLLSEFRVSQSGNSLPRIARTSIPRVSVSNVGSYGGNNFFREYEQERTQVQETITYVAPNYTIKFGADFNKTSIFEIFAGTANGSYSFSNIADFRAGNWSSYDQRFGLGGLTALQSGYFDTSGQEEAYFIQGDFRLNNELKLGVGLRQDQQKNPKFGIANFANPTTTTAPLTAQIPDSVSESPFGWLPLDPRLSLTWTPNSDQGKTVVRLNAGRYSSRTPAVFQYQVYTVNGVRATSIRFNAANQTSLVASYPGFTRGTSFNWANPYAFSSMPVGSSAPKGDIFTFDPNFKNPITDRFNMSVEKAYDSGWTLGLNTVYARANQLERLKDINLGTPTVGSDGRKVFPSTRPNANFGKMMMYVSDASGIYQAITFSAKFDKADSPISGQFFYTWSANRDNDSNERNFSSYGVQNTQDLMADYSYADTDRRHVFTGFFSYFHAPSKVMSGVNVRYSSGTPYSATVGSDLNADGISGNDRLYWYGVDTGRNSLRRSSYTTVDIKLSRDFSLMNNTKLTLSAEVFDLFNRMDTFNFIRALNGTTYNTPSPSSTGQTRQVQLGVRLSF